MNHLIPLPASLLPTQLEFQLGPDTQILVAPATPETLRVSEFLAAALRRATDYALPIVPDPPAHARDQIFLTLHDDSTLGAEGYELNLTPDGVFLRAQTPAGLFYGIQTLLQLGAPSSAQEPKTWRAATGSIRDVPRFAWRGAMLDVARHFFSVQDIKDDQGWRIEIKTWDKLATIGGSGGVGGKKSGYYTQDEYRELVAYAAERFIVIVPEIDTPGHTNAALAAYPELNCDGVARELYTGIEVGFSSLCLDKEITYQFLEDVIRELAALTPGEFIHIGGDEAHATDKTAYTQF
ncbi:MAG: beta-N-acetylhexosaminidase, partial [Chloroflexi bacterium]